MIASFHGLATNGPGFTYLFAGDPSNAMSSSVLFSLMQVIATVTVFVWHLGIAASTAVRNYSDLYDKILLTHTGGCYCDNICSCPPYDCCSFCGKELAQ